ncbi:hypothetical protein [Tropicimonas marinistellae]|uniref:hypothetical protein n=1 Tax=Tropicimonas marinistellae TaxID=1739787 RepID=UPI000829CEBE|nr:hypothetical protein [Tropicimonas marinistellae]
MFDPKKLSFARDTPECVPIVATVSILALTGCSIITTPVVAKVLAGAFTVFLAYLSVCVTCHAATTIRDRLCGTGSTFQNWR